MPEPLIKVDSLLSAGNIRPQILEALKQLKDVLRHKSDASGRAYLICSTWQRRFELALRSEIPEWVGLAGFRCITDFTIPTYALNNKEELKKFFPPKPNKIKKEDCRQDIGTFEECWRAFEQYFEARRDLHSGKFQLQKEAEKHFLSKLDLCEQLLGGQAGNILWLWRCIGADSIGFVPYFAKGLSNLRDKMPELGDLKVLRFENNKIEIRPLEQLNSRVGVFDKSGSDRIGAPSGGSIIMFKDGRRLIYQFKGFRDLEMRTTDSMPWDRVQFFFKDNELLEKPIHSENPSDITWPIVHLFCECYIDSSKTLCIRFFDDEEVKKIAENVDFAVLGGIDAIFFDSWIKKDPTLQAKLLEIIERQMRVLSANGVRIGVEISGFPHRDYAIFLRRLCREGVIVAAGINGVDELPDVVGERILIENNLYDFWLDPKDLKNSLQSEAKDPKLRGEHFEYITYLRAKRLAEVMGVRTLYVHTMTLDIILRKEADPGSLLRAQLGDMMGKGLVIAALLRRAHRGKWVDELNQKITPAVKPEAMSILGKFASDFAHYEENPGAEDRLLHSGFSLAPTPNDYSLAIVPVMWPHHEEVTKDLNATGSGDMTFGAFFFLGGV
jgi:hypothetical protein